ncbi:hypothetical protein AAHA92_13767 [Salvia divinorum]|uniref:Uncharacterized protein n=1 Tax=Salvia divinorum TaxID=28513 RepID=A0ABD1H9C4_SALDI
MEASKNCTAPHRGEAEEEEDEAEEKMEIFVALMTNFRNKLHQLQENSGGKRKRSSTSAGGWAPAFKLEDFTADIQFKKPMPACNNSNGNAELINGRLLRPDSPSSPNLKLGL